MQTSLSGANGRQDPELTLLHGPAVPAAQSSQKATSVGSAHRDMPSGHARLAGSANPKQIEFRRSMQGPRLPNRHPWHTSGVVVADVVGVVVTDVVCVMVIVVVAVDDGVDVDVDVNDEVAEVLAVVIGVVDAVVVTVCVSVVVTEDVTEVVPVLVCDDVADVVAVVVNSAQRRNDPAHSAVPASKGRQSSVSRFLHAPNVPARHPRHSSPGKLQRRSPAGHVVPVSKSKQREVATCLQGPNDPDAHSVQCSGVVVTEVVAVVIGVVVEEDVAEVVCVDETEVVIVVVRVEVAVVVGVGLTVGMAVGFAVGLAVGFAVGLDVGSMVGLSVGKAVGDLVGSDEVGTAVGDALTHAMESVYAPSAEPYPSIVTRYLPGSRSIVTCSWPLLPQPSLSTLAVTLPRPSTM